jgi:hypothetical protein
MFRHLAALNSKHGHFPAPAAADFEGGIWVSAEMHVMPPAPTQSFPHDPGKQCGFSAVVEDRRRLDGFQLKININTVTLRSPDAHAVVAQDIAALVVRVQKVPQAFGFELTEPLSKGGEHILDTGPALPI